MLSLEPEIATLRPTLGDARADALIARARREVFSVYPELRIAAWGGAMLLATAAGLVLKNNLDRLGPLALSLMIGAAAIACYAWTWFRRARATLVADYVLLLGALLVSADVAFIESQYHLFDEQWKHHLIILAVVHAIGAYAYGSRMLLSLSIAALAGWIGFDRAQDPSTLGIPAFATAIVLIGWREADRRFHGPEFSRTFEHFAANVALFGALAFIPDHGIAGLALTAIIVAMVIAWGFAARHEPFVMYAVVYAVIAVVVYLEQRSPGWKPVLFTLIIALAVAVISLVALHRLFARSRA
jgi:Predicted membrane protein (DUF2157).